MAKKMQLEWMVQEGFVTDFCRKRFIETEDVHEGIRALQIMVPGIPCDIAEAVVRGSKKIVGTRDLYLEDDDQVIEPYGWIKPGDIAKYRCGWIAPDGRAFGHKTYNEQDDHDELAEGIVRRREVAYDGRSYYSSVEDAGWIKFSPDKALTYARAGEVTEAQRQAVVRFVEAQICAAPDHEKCYQLGPNALGIVTLSEIRQLDLLQFGRRISIH